MTDNSRMIKSGDRVTYRDLNLWDHQGEVHTVDGQFCTVTWDRHKHIGPVKEWVPNLMVHDGSERGTAS